MAKRKSEVTEEPAVIPAEDPVEETIAEEPEEEQPAILFEEVPAEGDELFEVISEEPIHDLEELWKMTFRDGYGNLVKVRKAYKPRGKLEFYWPGR